MPISEEEFCNDFYGEIQSSGCCGRYVEISHRALERKLPSLPKNATILEVGGNLGEHCKYVSHPYQSYIVSDYRKVTGSLIDPKVSFDQQNAETLSYQDNDFDQVLMGCLLHHVDFPEKALRQIRRVVKSGGLVSITLPCDPGLLYRFGKRISPYRAHKKKYPEQHPEYFHYQQHRNHYPGLRSLIYEVFRDDRIIERSFPFPLRIWNMNLFSIFQIEISK